MRCTYTSYPMFGMFIKLTSDFYYIFSSKTSIFKQKNSLIYK